MKNILILILLFSWNITLAEESLTRKNISYDSLSWGFNINVGYLGKNYPLISSNSKIKSGSQFSMNVGFHFKKVQLFINYSNSEQKLKGDLDFNYIWKSGQGISAICYDIEFGYKIIGCNAFTIIPYISGGAKSFYLINKSTQNDSIVDHTSTYGLIGLGSLFNFNLLHFKAKAIQKHLLFTLSLCGKGDYLPMFYSKPLGFKGGLLSGTIGIMIDCSFLK